MSRVGDKIRNARLKAKMSEKQLGKKIGANEKFIKDVEAGRKIINDRVMDRISKVLGSDLNDVTMNFEEQAIKEEKQNKVQKKQLEKVNEVWDDAFGSVLKTVPVYGYDLNKSIGKRQLPVVSNKIEGFGKDKVLFLKIDDDDLIGSRIAKGDIAFCNITSEIVNNGIYLIERNDVRVIRQIKKLDSQKILLISNGGRLNTETVIAKDIKILVRLHKVEINL
ncbi:XRE family transcriptional regulator [Clostridium sediminicola]|uniref:S24 family peptidase n=1 Tax=Clostridium sediminicola TaxID=3114879 RepID=UPI0031F25B76